VWLPLPELIELLVAPTPDDISEQD
jgi:hypothetical protein